MSQNFCLGGWWGSTATIQLAQKRGDAEAHGEVSYYILTWLQLQFTLMSAVLSEYWPFHCRGVRFGNTIRSFPRVCRIRLSITLVWVAFVRKKYNVKKMLWKPYKCRGGRVVQRLGIKLERAGSPPTTTISLSSSPVLRYHAVQGIDYRCDNEKKKVGNSRGDIGVIR
jgi:hypothetical protein